MADEPENLVLAQLRELRDRARRGDEKLDKVLDGIAELRQMVSGIVQILASHDQHMLAMEVRLGRIEKRLDLVDPAVAD